MEILVNIERRISDRRVLNVPVKVEVRNAPDSKAKCTY